MRGVGWVVVVCNMVLVTHDADTLLVCVVSLTIRFRLSQSPSQGPTPASPAPASVLCSSAPSFVWVLWVSVPGPPSFSVLSRTRSVRPLLSLFLWRVGARGSRGRGSSLGRLSWRGVLRCWDATHLRSER